MCIVGYLHKCNVCGHYSHPDMTIIDGEIVCGCGHACYEAADMSIDTSPEHLATCPRYVNESVMNADWRERFLPSVTV